MNPPILSLSHAKAGKNEDGNVTSGLTLHTFWSIQMYFMGMQVQLHTFLFKKIP